MASLQRKEAVEAIPVLTVFLSVFTARPRAFLTTIFAAAKHLPQREREILYLRFGEDLTQSEIAERVGVSQMQVSRLLRRSLHRLRQLTGETR